MPDEPDHYALIMSKPTFQGTLQMSTLMQGPRAMCEEWMGRAKHPVPNGPEVNVGKIEIIPIARWRELRDGGFIR
jgi:hypothetical protein